MTEENEVPEIIIKPEEEEVRKTSLSRTLVSLALFIALDYWLFQSWLAVLLLVTVIFLHEAGHFIAMKAFGYKAVNMTFVPFVGAYVSGQATNLSKKNKLIVLLAGPLPGIIIGCIVFYLYHQNFNQYYYYTGISFLALNVLNLLPVFPLDGGQFFQTLFFHGSRIIQLFFLFISFCCIIFLFFQLHYSWGFLLVAVLVIIRMLNLNFIYNVRKELDEKAVDYSCSYDDLTDEEYWQIRNVVISKSKRLSKKYSTDYLSENEQPLIRYVESVLAPAYDDDLNATNKIIFTLIWAVFFAMPVLEFLYYRGHL